MAPVEKPPRIDPARVQQEQEEGHKAGIAFATDEAKYRDLLMLRKFLELPCDSDFAASRSRTIRTSATASLPTASLATRKPSHPMISFPAFARAAVEALEENERRK